MCATVLLAILVGMACSERTYAKQVPPATNSNSSACTAASIVAGQPWRLEYSFGGGIMPGTGTVNLLLASDGKAVVTVKHYKKPPSFRTVTVPPAEMDKITKTLTKWPPTCIHTVLRQGYIVYDNGAYSLQFTSGASSSTALFDECHFVDNADGFQAIYDAIQRLAPYIGKEITWSSGVSTSVKGDMCAPKREGSNPPLKPSLNSSPW